MQNSQKNIYHSSVRNYQIQNKTNIYQKGSLNNAQSTKYNLGKTPKLKNQIQLQLPTQRQLTKKNYIQNDGFEILQKIFPCCYAPIIQPDFIDCDYCDRRVYKKQSSAQNDTEPYLSYQRILQRQKQPVNVFYQQITNQKIRNNRFNDEDLS